MSDAIAMVNEFLKRFGQDRGIELPPLVDGVGQVQRGSAVVTVQVMPDRGVLLMHAPVMRVPEGSQEVLYRRLLELSFLATGDAAFAINAETNEVYLRALRRLEGLDYDEFDDLLHTVATVADDWDDKLKEQFGGGA